jgi:hypothetical protein
MGLRLRGGGAARWVFASQMSWGYSALPVCYPVEHPPLVAEQLLGEHRQFVYGDEARQRLPELA